MSLRNDEARRQPVTADRRFLSSAIDCNTVTLGLVVEDWGQQGQEGVGARTMLHKIQAPGRQAGGQTAQSHACMPAPALRLALATPDKHRRAVSRHCTRPNRSKRPDRLPNAPHPSPAAPEAAVALCSTPGDDQSCSSKPRSNPCSCRPAGGACTAAPATR